MPSPTATARKVMTLATLADVRMLIAKHLPEHFRDKQSWRHVAAELDKAAAGDTAEASLAPCMVLSLEGVECRPKVTPILVGSGGDSAISLSLRVVRFEQTHVDNARQISGLTEWSGRRS
jgi:hypothetical protein